MKEVDVATWVQAGTGIILLFVTFWYTRISTKVVANQAKPYFALLISELSTQNEPLELTLKNVGNGVALEVSIEIMLRRWGSDKGDDYKRKVSAPTVEVGASIILPTPTAPNGQPMSLYELYRLFETVEFSIHLRDRLGRRLRQRKQYEWREIIGN
jgi:hypothetical protein